MKSLLADNHFVSAPMWRVRILHWALSMNTPLLRRILKLSDLVYFRRKAYFDLGLCIDFCSWLPYFCWKTSCISWFIIGGQLYSTNFGHDHAVPVKPRFEITHAPNRNLQSVFIKTARSAAFAKTRSAYPSGGATQKRLMGLLVKGHWSAICRLSRPRQERDVILRVPIYNY